MLKAGCCWGMRCHILALPRRHNLLTGSPYQRCIHRCCLELEPVEGLVLGPESVVVLESALGLVLVFVSVLESALAWTLGLALVVIFVVEVFLWVFREDKKQIHNAVRYGSHNYHRGIVLPLKYREWELAIALYFFQGIKIHQP